MATTHNLGFPRIGAKRELKFAVEKYWDGRLTAQELDSTATNLRTTNWNQQDIDWIPVGDFSFYDQVLDMSLLLGNIPSRAIDQHQSELDTYFRVARGRSRKDDSCCENDAGEMTKWFDTNYHYIVPEFSKDTEFSLNADSLFNQIIEAEQTQKQIKPVIIGPLTYLWLGKSIDDSSRLDLLNKLLPVYQQLFQRLEERGISWLQVDEPILVAELSQPWQKAFAFAYSFLAKRKINILLTSYFGELRENLPLACGLPIDGLHLDVSESFDEVGHAIDLLPSDTIVSLGVVSGRNIWKSNLNQLLDQLEPIAKQLKSRLWLAPSCSLMHVPVDLDTEPSLDPEISEWLAFAVQKLEEIRTLADAIKFGRDSVSEELNANVAAIESRQRSKRIHNSAVQERITHRCASESQRQAEFSTRAAKQRVSLQLPQFPTTTIGSFPQTDKIRRTRRQFKRGEISKEQYENAMRQEIADCVRWQEELQLDVLVHGEAERNDMVEYFGEQLEGCLISQNGWVQSYGSRCVKPPIIFGDVSRDQPMTVQWTRYAQSLTRKPMKGMLTGPVTILNWSFVRDDQPRSQTCEQIAFAIRDEVADLEEAGIKVIQIDEPALREGLPLRTRDTPFYLRWAVNCFRLASCGVADDTQIHTHMCYSEFNDIIESITDLDADVITIESSRSNMELIKAFTDFEYPNDIGPGVYDIHSPNTPSTEQMVHRIQLAMKFLPKERLWVNPDCGLKTRRWSEVTPAIRNMVSAAQELRNAVSSSP